MKPAYFGIDLGKTGLVIAYPPDSTADQRPARWPVVAITYRDPLWWKQLLSMTALGDTRVVLAFEPTGHHLAAPLASLIDAHRPNCELWLVDGKLTRSYRDAHVASAKTDPMDARALALIARDIAADRPPRGVRPYDFSHESAVQRLRMLVNRHARLTKESTRTKNRLNALAHSLWPSFAGSPTWQRAARLGYATPAQLFELAAMQPPHPEYAHGQKRRWLLNFVNQLPLNLRSDPAVTQQIGELLDILDDATVARAASEEMIRALIQQPPFARVTRRWMTLPGWNVLELAAVHVATHGRADELEIDQFCAAAGVTPLSRQSGGINGDKLTGKGYRPCRTALHMWAFRLLSPHAADNAIRRYFERRGKTGMAACRTKLARILSGVARDSSLDAAPTSAEAAPESPSAPE